MRALGALGIELPNLKKPTRIEYLRKYPEGTEFLKALHQYYVFSDLLSDCEGWIKYSCEDGHLYPNVNPFGQVTGRSAYSEPALQNTPKEPDEEGALSLRDCIRAPEGVTIVKADYAAQELRILAHVTSDPSLIAACAEGDEDPHVKVAEKIAGHPLQKGTEEYKIYRKLAKRANYGFSYGAGAKRYAQSVFEDTSERITKDQAKREQTALQATWERTHRWQQEFGGDGNDEDDWYTVSFVGRRRYVSQNKDRASGAYVPNYCDRLNGPIQTGGADTLYVALEKLIEDKEAGLHPGTEILLTTHDEIVLECPEDDEGVLGWLVEKMRKAAGCFLRPELASEDCVEGVEGSSWGGG